jgi:hypothetical protein
MAAMATARRDDMATKPKAKAKAPPMKKAMPPPKKTMAGKVS